MERKVLEESWRRKGPVGPSLDVIDVMMMIMKRNVISECMSLHRQFSSKNMLEISTL
jgi:hypothetical protein